MLRRDFLGGLAVTFLSQYVWGLPVPKNCGELLAKAALAQLGVTTSYDPSYVRIPYPNGDVPRQTGVCADVVVRAARDGLGLDLQQLVHEDMVRHFSAYPSMGAKRPDANIDHRRVLNLEVFWMRAGARLWEPSKPTAGDGFPAPIQVGDLLTWMLDARLPHVGVVVARDAATTRILHNVGRGVEENDLVVFHPHRAHGHYRWPAT
ncbi:MAG: DUF1287 domain-containing protein [Acidobacteriaceae bacterium]|nr:DUF1287 domain-containing protein [Acidobacteriaceae bacterium]